MGLKRCPWGSCLAQKASKKALRGPKGLERGALGAHKVTLGAPGASLGLERGLLGAQKGPRWGSWRVPSGLKGGPWAPNGLKKGSVGHQGLRGSLGPKRCPSRLLGAHRGSRKVLPPEAWPWALGCGLGKAARGAEGLRDPLKALRICGGHRGPWGAAPAGPLRGPQATLGPPRTLRALGPLAGPQGPDGAPWETVVLCTVLAVPGGCAKELLAGRARQEKLRTSCGAKFSSVSQNASALQKGMNFFSEDGGPSR